MNAYQGPMQPFPGLERYARTAQVQGRTLFYYDAGDPSAPAMLLVHGLADEADTWRHLIGPLAESSRVLAPDLPGFGRSEEPGAGFGIAPAAATMLALLDVLGIARATWVGHSLGAGICHWVGLQQPQRVERLALLSGSLLRSAPEAKRKGLRRSQKVDPTLLAFLVPGLGEWLYTRLRRDPDAAYRTLAPYYVNLDGLPAADREFLYQRVNERVWSDRQRRAFFATLRGMARGSGAGPDLASRLATLAVPTVAVWGEQDRINPLENGRALVEMQPTARLVTVPNAGHDVQQEQPEAVLAAIAGAEPLGNAID